MDTKSETTKEEGMLDNRGWCPNCGYIIDEYGKCCCEEGEQSSLKIPIKHETTKRIEQILDNALLDLVNTEGKGLDDIHTLVMIKHLAKATNTHLHQEVIRGELNSLKQIVEHAEKSVNMNNFDENAVSKGIATQVRNKINYLERQVSGSKTCNQRGVE